MENRIHIQHHHLFDADVFEKHPMLFEVYAQNNINGMGMKIQEKRQSLFRYIEKVAWPAITGPGFCGATNPGAGKSFNGIMTGLSNPVYNSDSLYVNSGAKIFAVSDSPGVTTLSRDLFRKLDRRLGNTSIEDLETIIYDLGYGIAANQQATLALISFQEPTVQGNYGMASVIIAGDTIVYHGNLLEERFDKLDGVDHFWGTSHRHLNPKRICIKEGDFFVIVSDGIDALNRRFGGNSIQDVLWRYVKKDPQNFAYNVMTACNEILREDFNGRGKTVLGGYDDITSLLIFPHFLSDSVHHSHILGGNIW